MVEGASTMITLYTSPSSTSCRKARRWLQANELPYKERNIFADPLTRDEIKQVLTHTELGTDEIIAVNSKLFKTLALDMDVLSLSGLIDLVVAHPALLRRPILMDEKRLQVGYDKDEIRRFIPRAVREADLNWCQTRLSRDMASGE